MKKLITIFIGLSLLFLNGISYATPVDCSGLPKSHNVDMTIKTTAGVDVITAQDTTEVTNALLLDSVYWYNFTTETAGTTYIVQCLDITDPTNNFTFTLSGRETFVNAAVGSIPTNPTLQTTWTDAKAGYLTGAVALDSTVAKEATLANATYGLSALQVLLDAIATSTELTAMFDAIKGVGWTTQTLVAIQAAIGSSGLSAQEVRDAMKLAPTAGSSAAGSVDKKLDNIERHN